MSRGVRGIACSRWAGGNSDLLVQKALAGAVLIDRRSVGCCQGADGKVRDRRPGTAAPTDAKEQAGGDSSVGVVV